MENKKLKWISSKGKRFASKKSSRKSKDNPHSGRVFLKNMHLIKDLNWEYLKKKTLQLHNKKTNNLIKNGPKIWRHIPEDAQTIH